MIIAVDFDGTLCENAYPRIGKPKQNVIEYVKQQKANGATIILWTCRSRFLLSRAVYWAKKQEIKFDYINENVPSLVKQFNGDCRKVYADVYLDDKAICIDNI